MLAARTQIQLPAGAATHHSGGGAFPLNPRELPLSSYVRLREIYVFCVEASARFPAISAGFDFTSYDHLQATEAGKLSALLARLDLGSYEYSQALEAWGRMEATDCRKRREGKNSFFAPTSLSCFCGDELLATQAIPGGKFMNPF